MRILAIILTVLLLCPGYAAMEPRPRWGRAPTIRAQAVALNPGDPAVSQVGALSYLGGVALSSNDLAFGGFSSLLVRGREVTMLSDVGLWTRFALDDKLQPSGFQTGTLIGPGPARVREHHDSESLTTDPASGSLWVGWENHNAIWRYGPGFRTIEGMRWPKAMARWPRNGGPEAMARLRSGWFVVLSESRRVPRGGRAALAFDGDPTTRAPRFAFTYVPPAGYSPTDMTELPDGRLLIVNRRFALREMFTAKLTIVDARALKADVRVVGREIANLSAPIIHDNFEGVAITREGRATIVWLLSDDNGPSLFQRTLLLKFRLDLPPHK